MKQRMLPKKLRNTLLSELSRFAWLNLNKCGDVISCKDNSRIIWRIGNLRVKNGSAVRVTLEHASYGDKLPIKFLDETGPIGPSRSMEDKLVLNTQRWEKQVEIWENYTPDQKAFYGAINRMLTELFCESGYKSDRIEECFCVATLNEHTDAVYVFQAIKKHIGKECRILERRLEDWKFEDTNLSYDTTDMIEDESDAQIVIVSEPPNRMMLKLTGLYKRLLEIFSMGKVSPDIIEPSSPFTGNSYTYTTVTASYPEVPATSGKQIKKKPTAKKTLFEHKQSKLRTLYSLLSSGKAISMKVLAIAAYGSDDELSQRRMRRMITTLRKDGKYDIVAEKGKYRLILGDD